MGAIDGIHIEIKKPEGDSGVDYFSRKQKYTIANQAICDIFKRRCRVSRIHSRFKDV